HSALAIAALLASGKPDIVRRFGHVIDSRRERIASQGPSSRPAFECVYRQGGRSSELSRRDMGEVTVGRSEHDTFRRWPLLERLAHSCAGCEPGAGDVAIAVELRILEIDERDAACIEPPLQLDGADCGDPLTLEAERERTVRTDHPASGYIL